MGEFLIILCNKYEALCLVFCYTFSMKMTIGIDEVGRGPVTGPVTVGAMQVKGNRLQGIVKRTEKNLGIRLRDSKKLSRKQRELWFVEIQKWKQEGLCDFAVVSITAKEIDRTGISQAIKKCISVCLDKLVAPPSHKATEGHSSRKLLDAITILLDGGLKAPIQFKKQKTIIKGDEKEPVIALASIVAKVTRDRYMLTQAKKYPAYGFETNVGYGTKKQYMAIRKYGLTPLHRKTYLKNL